MATLHGPSKSSSDRWKNDCRQVYVEIPEPSEDLERLLRTYVRIRSPPSAQSPSSSTMSRSPSPQSSQLGPPLSHSGLMRSRPGPFTFSTASSPQLPTRYASLPRNAPKQVSLSHTTPVHHASTVVNTIRQVGHTECRIRSAAGPSSPRKKKTKLIFSHVEITKLEEVLLSRKWQNVRAGFMRELRKRRAQKLADQGKGKGRVIPQDKGSEEEDDDEAQVDRILQDHASASSFSPPLRSSRDGRSPIFLGTLPPHRPRKRISYARFGSLNDDDEDLNLRDIELFGDNDSDEFVLSDDERKSRKTSQSYSGLLSQGSTADEGVPRVEINPTSKQRKGYPSKSLSQRESSSSRVFSKRHSTLTAVPKQIHQSRRSFLPPSEREAALKTKMLNAVGRPQVGPHSKQLSRWSHTRTLYSNRKCQRPLVEFTAEEERQLEKECVPRSCHMCHKKKWVMCCTGAGSPDSRKKCTAAFCDRCLARYPLPFDPFAWFLCPKCSGNCICSACVVLHEPDSVLRQGTEVALVKAAGKATFSF